jgi:hypothetical protein
MNFFPKAGCEKCVIFAINWFGKTFSVGYKTLKVLRPIEGALYCTSGVGSREM